MGGDFDVVVGAGTYRVADAAVHFAHRWTVEGVSVQATFTGAHLLHLSVAGCVLNDLYREAATMGIGLSGARVSAGGDFDTGTWISTGISYAVELDSAAPSEQLSQLVGLVDAVAEIPRAIRAAATVRRTR
jgi:uncharacterized OsmC-like protein